MKKIDSVYIIEDDAISSFIIKRIVDDHLKAGESRVFENGWAALQSLADILVKGNEYPDLILLDINMPVMDGWEFLDALSLMQSCTAIPVFILTSSISPHDMERAKSYKAVRGFLSKPFSHTKLEEILK